MVSDASKAKKDARKAAAAAKRAGKKVDKAIAKGEPVVRRDCCRVETAMLRLVATSLVVPLSLEF
jgi:hypothetical protein